MGSIDLSMVHLEEAGVAVSPGRGFGEDGEGTRYFTMYYVRGKTLTDILQSDTVADGSREAYFKLLEKAPHLVEALKLGTKVVVTTAEGNVVAICGVGNEKMTDAQVAEVFVARKKK